MRFFKNLRELKVKRNLIWKQIEHFNSGNKNKYPISFPLEAFGVSKCGYYNWENARSGRDIRDLDLRDEIEKIAVEYPVAKHQFSKMSVTSTYT